LTDTVGGNALIVKGAAVSAFAELGYHGTSVREITRRARTSVATLYHYYASKEELLAELVDGHLHDLLRVLGRADAEAGSEPHARLSAIVRAHVTFHLRRSAEGRVCNAELHRLPPEARAGAISQRRRERALFEAVLAAGVENGTFAVPNVEAAARAVLEMCTAVLDLYDEDPSDVAQLADTYSTLALNVAGYRWPDIA